MTSTALVLDPGTLELCLCQTVDTTAVGSRNLEEGCQTSGVSSLSVIDSQERHESSFFRLRFLHFQAQKKRGSGRTRSFHAALEGSSPAFRELFGSIAPVRFVKATV